MSAARRELALVSLLVALAAGVWFLVDGWGGSGGAVVSDARPLADPVQHAPRHAATRVQTRHDRGSAQPRHREPIPIEPPASERELARAAAEAGGPRIAGRVLLPASAPREPELAVVARGRTGRERFEVRAAVDLSQRFQLDLPAHARLATLDLEALFLYLDPPLVVELTEPLTTLVLEPSLGGRLAVRLVGAPGTAPELLAGVEVKTFPTARGPARTDEHGVARFDGVPAGLELHVHAAPAGLVPVLSAGSLAIEAGGVRELDLELVPEARVTGAVRAADGRPLAGAEVSAAVSSPSSSMFYSAGATSTTDASGTFEIGGLRAGAAVLQVEHPEHLPAEFPLRVLAAGERRDGVELSLTSGLGISGRITWPDGRPAVVTLVAEGPQEVSQARGQRPPASVRSRVDGRFELAGLKAGTYTLDAAVRPTRSLRERLTASGHLEPSDLARPHFLARLEGVASGSSGVELVLRAGSPLRGRVLDEQGRPFERAEVLVRRLRGDGALVGPIVRDVRDGEGAFVWDDFAPGTYELTASGGAGPGEPRIVSVPTEDQELVARAPRGVQIVGVVLSGGEAVPGARVILTRPESRREGLAGHFSLENRREVHTGERGRFELASVGAGDHQVRATSGELGTSTALVTIRELGEESAELVLELVAPGRIEGRLAPELAPLANRLVVLDREGGSDSYQVLTDGEGRFELGHLIPDVYGLALFDTGGGERWREQACAAAEVSSGGTTQVLLTRESGRVRLSGQVVSGGRPLAGRGVSAQVRRRTGDAPLVARTDDAGRFELELPRGGWVSFTFSGEGVDFCEERRVSHRGESQIVFDLPSGSISGRLEARDGTPAAHARVVLGRGGSSLWIPGREGRADGEGRFVFHHVAPGQYRCQGGGPIRGARADSELEVAFGSALSPVIELTEGEQHGDLRIVLPGAGSIGGRVHGAGSSAELAVEAWASPGTVECAIPEPASTAIVRDGSYRLRGLGPGTYTVKLWGATLGAQTELGVSLAEGQVLELDFELD